MIHSKWKFILLPVIFLTLLSSFIIVHPAFADNDVPPDDAAPTEAAVPTTDGNTTDATSTTIAEVEPKAAEAVAAEEVPPVSDTMAVAEVEPTAAEAVAAEEIPAGSNTSAADTVIPTEAEDSGIVRTSGEITLPDDPYFIVGAMTYNYDTMHDALINMEKMGVTPSDRTLHVNPGTYNENVEINGKANGVSGLTTIAGEGKLPTDTRMNGELMIHDMAGGFTVKNLQVTNSSSMDDAAIWVNNNKGTTALVDVITHATQSDSSGILILNSANVVLNRVTSDSNAYKGADLYHITGTVTIQNSTFNNNLLNVNDGSSFEASPINSSIRIYNSSTTAAININGITVNNNIGDGVDVIASLAALTIKNSVVASNDPAHSLLDWGNGLSLNANSITLENDVVQANDRLGILATGNAFFNATNVISSSNGLDGLNLSMCNGSPCSNTGAGTVKIKGLDATSNGGYGLYINSKGAISIYQATTSGNNNDGIYMLNTSPVVPPPVTLTLITSNANAGGINIIGGGAITLKNIAANSNIGNGLYLYNTGPLTMSIDTSAPAIFNETLMNGACGTSIVSKGAVSITSLNSSNNNGWGLLIDNTQAAGAAPVTIKVADALNTYSAAAMNTSGALNILSHGSVIVSNFHAYNNAGNGAYVSNIPAAGGAAVPVSIANSFFNSTCFPAGACVIGGTHTQPGLNVFSNGSIALSNVQAVGNDGTGVSLNNAYPNITAGVTINATAAGANLFNGNNDVGLNILSNGAVMITNLTASNNLGICGTNIDNSGGNSAVTIKQLLSPSYLGNAFDDNKGQGLNIHSNGTVTVALAQANDNILNGVVINANGGPGAVSITGIPNLNGTMHDNGASGLVVNAKGTITITNIDSRNNGNNGASIDNHFGNGAVTITGGHFDRNIVGLSVISNGALTLKGGGANLNSSHGYYLRTIGAASLTNIGAAGNNSNGIDLVNNSGVTFTNVSSTNNDNGIIIWAGGAVTFTGVYAFDDSGDGCDINSTGPVTINKPVDGGYNTFGPEGATGLSITTPGAVKIARVNAINTHGNGIYIQVTNAAGTSPVSITDVIVNGNSHSGIWVTTTGTVTINSAQTIENLDHGIRVIQGSPSSAFAISVSKINASYNTGDGIYVTGEGNVTLSKFITNHNGGSGVYIDNSEGTGTVTILNPAGGNLLNTARANGNFGVYIASKGTVNATGIDINGSGNDGLEVINSSSSTSAPVTLTSIMSGENAFHGVNVSSSGIVTLNSSWTYSNTEWGIDVCAPAAIYIKNSTANNNGWAGIAAFMAGSGKTYLYNSIWFGNMAFDGDYGNLYVSGGIAIIS